jgi:HlyD family secretion protein
VDVQQGDAVVTGQPLASLDTTSLQTQLAQKEAAVAQAKLTLHNAVQAVTAASTTTTTSAPRTTTTSTTVPPSAGPSPVQLASEAETRAQGSADAALAKAATSLSDANSACASGSDESTCAAAQQTASADQQAVASAQAALAKAQSALTGALSDAARAGSGSGAGSRTGAAAAPARSAATPAASVSAASRGSSLGGATPTIADLVAGQAAVDAAAADVAVVEQQLAQATIVSPIGGRIAEVSLRAGQSVGASSATAHVVIVGSGGYEVTTTVAVNDVDKVKIGGGATVIPDGTKTPLDGKVVSIAVSPTTTGTTTTYPVVVGLTGVTDGLRNGASATVTLDVAHTADALTVPTSAVRTVGTLHVVTLLTAGKTSTVPVQTGTVGPDRTEITSGVTAGQTVVLANLDDPLPASNTNTNARFGGIGGLGGGGLGGGGTGLFRGGG